jgi:hypothetical protein
MRLGPHSGRDQGKTGLGRIAVLLSVSVFLIVQLRLALVLLGDSWLSRSGTPGRLNDDSDLASAKGGNVFAGAAQEPIAPEAEQLAIPGSLGKRDQSSTSILDEEANSIEVSRVHDFPSRLFRPPPFAV